MDFFVYLITILFVLSLSTLVVPGFEGDGKEHHNEYWIKRIMKVIDICSRSEQECASHSEFPGLWTRTTVFITNFTAEMARDNQFILKTAMPAAKLLTNDDLNILMLAALGRFDMVVIRFVERHPEWLTLPNQKGRNLLHYICWFGRSDLLQRLQSMETKSNDPDYGKYFFRAWKAVDNDLKIPIEYFFDLHAKENPIKVFEPERLLYMSKVITANGFVFYGEMLEKMDLVMLNRIIDHYPDFAKGPSKLHGNIFHHLARRPHLIKKEIISTLWSRFPLLIHEMDLFGEIPSKSLPPHVLHEMKPDHIHSQPFWTDDRFVDSQKYNDPNYCILVNSNIESVDREVAEELGLYENFFQLPTPEPEIIEVLEETFYESNESGVAKLMRCYDFVSVSGEPLKNLYLDAMDSPLPVFTSLIANQDNFYMALYNWTDVRSVIVDAEFSESRFADIRMNLATVLILSENTVQLRELIRRYPDLLCFRDAHGANPLIHAVVSENEEAVREIIALGDRHIHNVITANIDVNGYDALYHAIIDDHISIVKLLVKQVYFFDQWNCHGLNPIHVVVRYGSWDCFRAMIEEFGAAQATFKTSQRFTVLHLAMENPVMTRSYLEYVISVLPKSFENELDANMRTVLQRSLLIHEKIVCKDCIKLLQENHNFRLAEAKASWALDKESFLPVSLMSPQRKEVKNGDSKSSKRKKPKAKSKKRGKSGKSNSNSNEKPVQSPVTPEYSEDDEENNPALHMETEEVIDEPVNEAKDVTPGLVSPTSSHREEETVDDDDDDVVVVIPLPAQEEIDFNDYNNSQENDEDADVKETDQLMDLNVGFDQNKENPVESESDLQQPISKPKHESFDYSSSPSPQKDQGSKTNNKRKKRSKKQGNNVRKVTVANNHNLDHGGRRSNDFNFRLEKNVAKGGGNNGSVDMKDAKIKTLSEKIKEIELKEIKKTKETPLKEIELKEIELKETPLKQIELKETPLKQIPLKEIKESFELIEDNEILDPLETPKILPSDHQPELSVKESRFQLQSDAYAEKTFTEQPQINGIPFTADEETYFGEEAHGSEYPEPAYDDLHEELFQQIDSLLTEYVEFGNLEILDRLLEIHEDIAKNPQFSVLQVFWMRFHSFAISPNIDFHGVVVLSDAFLHLVSILQAPAASQIGLYMYGLFRVSVTSFFLTETQKLSNLAFVAHLTRAGYFNQDHLNFLISESYSHSMAMEQRKGAMVFEILNSLQY